MSIKKHKEKKQHYSLNYMFNEQSISQYLYKTTIFSGKKMVITQP